MPNPRLAEALKHNDALLAIETLSDDERTDALLQRAECLSRLERFDDSRKTVAQIPASADASGTDRDRNRPNPARRS